MSNRPEDAPYALRRLIRRLRPHRGTLAIASVCLVLSTAVGLAFPLVVRYLLDAAFVERSAALLGTIAIALALLFAVQGVLHFVEAYLLSATGERVVARLRTDLFGHLLSLSPGFHAARSSGELSSRLASDCSTLQAVLGHQLAELARQVLYLFGGLTLLALLHWRLLFTTLAVAPAVVLIAVLFGRWLRVRSTEVQDRLADSLATAEEALGQVDVVQSFVREPLERRRYDERIGAALKAAISRAFVRGIFFGVLTFVAFGAIVIVLWQGGRLVITGEITAGQLVSFLLYAFQVAAAISTLAGLWSAYQEAQGAARRVFELLDRRAVIRTPSHPEIWSEPGPPSIRFENVSFRYGPEEPDALDGIDVRIAPGEIVALVGPSGAGKTTFISLIPRFWDPSDGSIHIAGHELRHLDPAQLRTRIGLVPQDHPLIAGSVTDNIAYGRPDASTEDIEAAARAAHAHDFILELAAGYDTPVGERGVRLSGGQRQRIAIARVFLKQPDVVLLDEATSSLDAASEAHVEAALEELLRGRTTVIIAHRLRTVRRADRLIVLDGGAIVEQGPHADLLAAGGLYASLFESQHLDFAQPAPARARSISASSVS